jgi:hypothetical protein
MHIDFWDPLSVPSFNVEEGVSKENRWPKDTLNLTRNFIPETYYAFETRYLPVLYVLKKLSYPKEATEQNDELRLLRLKRDGENSIMRPVV